MGEEEKTRSVKQEVEDRITPEETPDGKDIPFEKKEGVERILQSF